MAAVFYDLGYTTGAEIGVKYGTHAQSLCKNNPDLHLYCIDPWAPYDRVSSNKQEHTYREAVQNLRDYPVTIIRKPSLEAIHDFEDGSLDFVYIDGAHDFDNVMMDIICWNRKVRIGGVVAVHDYMAGFGAGVMWAVNSFTHCHNIGVWFVTREREPTALWVKLD
jgi:predicted O-methyltransferase YrrM